MFQRMSTALGGLDQNLQSMCRFRKKKKLAREAWSQLGSRICERRVDFLYVLCNLCVLHDWCLALARAR